MSDTAVVALAAATATGARVAAGVPLALAVAVAVAALVIAARRPWLLVLAGALLASSLGARSWQGLAESRTGPVMGWATLVSDPEPTERGVRVDLRLAGERFRASAFGSVAGQLRLRAAGESVEVRGIARLPAPDEVAWLAPRHIAARLEVQSVGGWSPGGPATRLANLLRRTLDRGARVMSDDHRALFAGFVLGDDREQSPLVVDEFRAAGLSHLLAVSGQNVAFVLAIVSPALRRLRLGGRFVATVAVIAFFALVTRFEPSVLRASVMAGMAALAVVLGREASGLRLLALAVTGLMLVDPMLVHSLGFGLSVAASAGIILLAPLITNALPGPRWLATATGITLGAQIGVAPLLVPAFGGLPLVALPANLLAAPAAGPLVAWGMTAGVAAGVLQPLTGNALPRALHLPTDVFVAWIAGVARTAARLPLGELRLGHLIVLGAVLSLVLVHRRMPRLVRSAPTFAGARSVPGPAVTAAVTVAVAVVSIATVLAVALTAMRSAVWPRAVHTTPADGAELWLDGRTHAAVVALDGDARASPVLEGLRRFGVRRVALLVVTSGTTRRPFHETLTAVRERYQPPTVVGPRHVSDLFPGAVPIDIDVRFVVGDLSVDVVVGGDGDSDEISVRVSRSADPAAWAVASPEAAVSGPWRRRWTTDVVAARARAPPDGSIRSGRVRMAGSRADGRFRSGVPRPGCPALRRDDARPGDGHPQPYDRLVLRRRQLLRLRGLPAEGRRAGGRPCRHPRHRRHSGCRAGRRRRPVRVRGRGA
jgi:competence protein ComEC